MHLNPLTPVSDQGKISPYYIYTISYRQVMRINKNINYGGTVASWLVRLTLYQVVWVSALAGAIVLFLGKTIYSHCASIHPGVQMVPANMLGVTLWWDPGGSNNTPSHFLSRKPELSASPMGRFPNSPN